MLDKSKTKSIIIALFITAVLVSGAGTVTVLAGGPVPAVTPLTPDGQITIGASDRCPVCAMFPARRPKAAAALSLKSGETFYFCGNGCLLRTWLRPEAYLGKQQADIDRVVVRDYFSGKTVDGRTAIFVAGSDVKGPMGPAIIALEMENQLPVFKKRHGGKTVFTLDRVDDALWKQISSRELPATPAN